MNRRVTTWFIILVFILLLIFVVYALVEAQQARNECREAGGVPVEDSICLDVDAVIEP